MRSLWIIFLLLSTSFYSFSQQYVDWKNVKNKAEKHVVFQANKNQQYGFDAYEEGRPINYYNDTIVNKNFIYAIPTKSVLTDQSDLVDAKLRNFKNLDTKSILFQVNSNGELLEAQQKNDSTFTLRLPSKSSNYTISVKYKGVLVGLLNVEILQPFTKKIIFVSLIKNSIDKNESISYLNKIYRQAGINFTLERRVSYNDSLFSDSLLFSNPSASNDRYTMEMRQLRDRFFQSTNFKERDAYIVFIIPGFIDESIKGYMVKNHGLAFISNQPDSSFNYTLAKQLGYGVGALDDFWLDVNTDNGWSDNLMDGESGTHLIKFQWLELQSDNSLVTYFDGDEDVKTNNGMVAYYFWEENENGEIVLAKNHPFFKILRPYKKNYFSYHLNLQDSLFEVVYSKGLFFVCNLHIYLFGLFTGIWLFSFIWLLIRRKRKKQRFRQLYSKVGIRILHLLYLGLVILMYASLNHLVQNYAVQSGHIADFDKQKIQKVVDNTLYNNNLKYDDQNDLKSEILIKKDHKWYMKRLKKVLYFNVQLDSADGFEYARYKGDSDSLFLRENNVRDLAESHYFVVTYYNSKKQIEYQKAYNHAGFEISDKMNVTDAAKRILLMVNGYRPTSLGNNLEQNFQDIQKNGLEFPNSSNLIYNFDRYDYWRPWNEIDLLFQKRLNPTETYYADGHFSVETSNHRSLLSFTHLASIYPKRCENPKKHTCFETKRASTGFFGDQFVSTIDLLPMHSNKRGFNLRYENGKVAAKNLMQMFNEIPSRSGNDTLYIVAHSMGYAYALGMIDEMRGKINFGGFYIISPENAKQGRIYKQEWKEVWQYGSKNNKENHEEPCLQDGIAPQSCAGGLSEKDRAYIPLQLYNRKGFYDSHFVGFYTWIFDIKQNEKGAIRQR
ncbi:MAG: hypothetical protein V4638_06210 [Bacteroidota bacterium]